MQAILTRYHGPTDTRPSRLTARADAGQITVSYDHALNGQQNHRAAAAAMIHSLGLVGTWQGGHLHDGSYVWTRLDDWSDTRIEEADPCA